MKLTKENIEEYLLLLVDNELDPAAVAAVEAFLQQHQEYRPLLEAYRATLPGKEEVCFFPGKESLLRQEPEAVPLKAGAPLRMWRQAAAIALLLGLGMALTLVLRNNSEKVSPVPGEPFAAIAPAGSHKPGKETKPEQAVPQPALAKATTHRPAMVQAPAAARCPLPPEVEQARKREVIAPLVTAAAPSLSPETASAPAGLAIEREPPRETLAIRKELPGWLPVKEESLDGMNDLVSQVGALRDNLAEKARILKKASFVIRIGDKDVIALGH